MYVQPEKTGGGKKMSLTNMQYDEIIRSYNRKQLENKRKQTERVELVYTQVPRIKEINDEISSLSLQTARTLLFSDQQSDCMKTFKAKLEALKKEKLTLLKANGFTPSYMEMKFTCPDCRDTGYIENTKCHCFKQAEVDILYNQCNIRDILSVENFSTFSFDYFKDDIKDHVTGKTPLENIKGVVQICHEFIDSFDTENRKYNNLLFFGETGVGKTFLTNCIAKSLIEKYKSVIYLSSVNFFDILADAEFSNSNIEAKNKVDEIMSCDLLIIDDLGTELSNSFTNSALFSFINERLLSKASTIISTNLIFPELMKRYSERITSRLAKEYTFLKIYGDDLRHHRNIKSK